MCSPIKHLKFTGETIAERPNSIRCRYKLSNGQLLSVYFTRIPNKGRSIGVKYVWMVAAHIGNGRKSANKWNNKRHAGPEKSTGTCGLEGLAVAARYIKAFAAHKIKQGAEMQIGWPDKKRMRAYMYLLRYDGFTLYRHEDNTPMCIAYRNPDYYEWIPNTMEVTKNV